MRHWAIWYRNLVIAWVVIGLPSIVIGYGFSGGELAIPTPAETGILNVAIWLLLMFFLVSPLVLWPLRTRGRHSGFGD